MSTALQPTSIESVIEARLKELPFPKTTAIDPEGKTYQQVHDEQIAEIEQRSYCLLVRSSSSTELRTRYANC